jgi:phosphoserine phosphatase RsbU/P
MRCRRSSFNRQRLRFGKVQYSVAFRSAADGRCRGGDVVDAVTTEVGAAMWVFIADVSSKGTLGVLHAEMLRNAFREAIAAGSSPASTLTALNCLRLDIPRCESATFASAFVGCLSPSSGTMRYASAGHDIAILFEAKEHRHLEPTGPVLGILPLASFTECEVPFTGDSVLVLATDGVTEARCSAEREFFFGTSGLVKAVLQHPRRYRSAAEALAREVDGFAGSHYRDDATFAVLWL